jgi:hypothetical protein
VAKFPTAKSSADVLNSLRSLYSQPHDFRTVVIDTADWLEDFIAAEVRTDYDVKELAYGKDNVYVTQRIYDVLVALTMLRDKRNMATILIAHSEVRRFDSPLTDPYDRYQPKLVKGVSALVQEWADACLFATYEVTTKKVSESFGQEKRRGISDGTRMLYTEERPGYIGKNRYKLPHELPLSFAKLAQHIPYYSSTATQKGK